MKKIMFFTFFVLTITWMGGSLWGASGQKLFTANGCAGCHGVDKGMEAKPFPSKQKLASIDFDTFKEAVINGRPGTAMTAKKVSDSDLKAMYNWLQKYK